VFRLHASAVVSDNVTNRIHARNARVSKKKKKKRVTKAAAAALQRVATSVIVPRRDATLAQLVRRNADYVVDCLCRSLRAELDVPPSTARVRLSVVVCGFSFD
jgi:tRNA A37 threonylcarbamoyladenosine dehydratase